MASQASRRNRKRPVINDEDEYDGEDAEAEDHGDDDGELIPPAARLETSQLISKRR